MHLDLVHRSPIKTLSCQLNNLVKGLTLNLPIIQEIGSRYGQRSVAKNKLLRTRLSRSVRFVY